MLPGTRKSPSHKLPSAFYRQPVKMQGVLGLLKILDINEYVVRQVFLSFVVWLVFRIDLKDIEEQRKRQGNGQRDTATPGAAGERADTPSAIRALL